jgi:hypothetical protein
MGHQEVQESDIKAVLAGRLDMKRMQHISLAVLGFVLALPSLAATAETNYCYNSTFTSSKGPLDGWNVNYDWTGNTKQMGNHDNVSVLPSFNGRTNVLKIAVPSGFESKVETPLIPYEVGDMYQCTFDICVEKVVVNTLFQGYNLKPGIPPSETPKLQNMRRMYKAEYVASKGTMWKTVTVSLPNAQITELSYSHLKKIRYITVLMYVPGATYFEDGNFYISNVRIVKLPGKAKVVK